MVLPGEKLKKHGVETKRLNLKKLISKTIKQLCKNTGFLGTPCGAPCRASLYPFVGAANCASRCEHLARFEALCPKQRIRIFPTFVFLQASLIETAKKGGLRMTMPEALNAMACI